MRIKVSNPKYGWHLEFAGQEFDVLVEDIIPHHHQLPVMTSCGPTWFDRDAVTVIEE